MAPHREGSEEEQWRDEFRRIGLPGLDDSVKFDRDLWRQRRNARPGNVPRAGRYWAWPAAAAVLVVLLLAGAPLLHSLGHQPSPTTRNKHSTQVWKVGSFTVSTHLLPKVYNPRDPGWQSFGVGQSAIYYVPKSTPNDLVQNSNGHTEVVANLPCATQGQVSPVGGQYLFVECVASGGKPEGILADPKTGATWTLWTGGSVPIATTYVSQGWAYFFASAYENGPLFAQGSVNLQTGVRGRLPSVMSDGGWGPLFSPDGTLYVQKYNYPSLAPTDLYRIDGLTATLVAHLPSLSSGIDANGAIWVSKKGGSLTPNAGAMTIRVWNSGINHSSPSINVLSTGPGYVIYVENSSIRLKLATPGGSKTITVGEGDAGDVFTMPHGFVFPAPHGRWQVLTVSGG